MPVELPEKFEKIIVNASQDWLDTRGTTRDKLRSFIEGRILRDKEISPKAGDVAPDFEAEVLDSQGKRTGGMLKLSSQFGIPIALIFGSYT